MKKYLLLAAAASTLFASTPANAESRFSDVSPNYEWASEAIDFLVEQGAVSGFLDGTFKPGNYVTKAEFAHMYNLLLPQEREGADKAPVFTDVKSTHWAAKDFSELFNFEHWRYAETVVFDKYGDIVKEYLNPDKQITRWDIAVLIAMLTPALDKNYIDNGVYQYSTLEMDDVIHTLSQYKDIKIRLGKDNDPMDLYSSVVLTWKDNYGEEYFNSDFDQIKAEGVYNIITQKVMEGSDGLFRPNAKVTRAEAATILYRTYQALTAF